MRAVAWFGGKRAMQATGNTATAIVANRFVRQGGIGGDRNQLGRRNLSPEDFRIISGRIYNRRKRQQGGDRKSKGQFGPLKDTADEVADELGTSPKTIERNAARSAVHDALLDSGDTEAAEIAKGATQADISAVKGKPAEQAAAGRETGLQGGSSD